MSKIKMNAASVNGLTDEQLGNLIMCTNDGQGDTSVRSVKDVKGWFAGPNGEEELKQMGYGNSNSEIIRYLWADTNGNMTEFIYVENNGWSKVWFEEDIFN